MIHQFEEIVKIRTICFSYSCNPEQSMGDCFFFGFACISDGAAMDDYYESLANCVQRYVCGPAGYCKSKNGGTECLFNFLFYIANESRIVLKRKEERP
jgi:hypothetical protein